MHRAAWEKHGVLPAQLADQTPHQLLALFAKREEKGGKFGEEKLPALKKFNERRAAEGQQPVVPSWLWKHIPRGPPWTAR